MNELVVPLVPFNGSQNGYKQPIYKMTHNAITPYIYIYPPLTSCHSIFIKHGFTNIQCQFNIIGYLSMQFLFSRYSIPTSSACFTIIREEKIFKHCCTENVIDRVLSYTNCSIFVFTRIVCGPCIIECHG